MRLVRTLRPILLLAAALLAAGCAGLGGREPLEVILVGLEPLDGQGMEMRMQVKLRVQNPNEAPIVFDGVSVRVELEGKRFASGVSNTGGTVPRFGETVIGIPVSVSLLGLARQLIDTLGGGPREKFAYEISGRLSGPGIGGMNFSSRGELAMPALGAGASRQGR